MIRSFADDATEDIWNGVNSQAAQRMPKQLWPIIQRHLDQIDAVTSVEDLRVPPGNRLHALGGDRAGQPAIRVNDQYRIVFRFDGPDACDVCCIDYH
jgi:toxin HigB-1